MSTHDEQAIENVAAAMCNADTTSWKNTADTQTVSEVAWDDMLDHTEYIPYEGISLGRDHYRTMARAALEAMREGEPLEDALGSVPPRTWFNVQGNDLGFVCLMQLPKKHGLDRDGRYVTGAGNTRLAAIRDAVADAKGGAS